MCTLVRRRLSFGDLLPEIKRRIALGRATFSKVTNIMKSRKANMNIKRKVHHEYGLPVMVYGSDTLTPKKAHVWNYYQSNSAKWSAPCSEPSYATTNVIPAYDTRHVYKTPSTLSRMGGTHCAIQRQYIDYKSDRVDITRTVPD